MTALYRLQRDNRIMAADTEIMNPAGGFQFQSIVQDAVIMNLLPGFKGIYIMKVSNIHIIGSIIVEHGLESSFYFRQFSGFLILTIFPLGAKMALKDKVFSYRCDSPSDLFLGCWVRCIHIEAGNAVLQGELEDRVAQHIIRINKALTSKTDFTEFQSGFSKLSVVHSYFLL